MTPRRQSRFIAPIRPLVLFVPQPYRALAPNPKGIDSATKPSFAPANIQIQFLDDVKRRFKEISARAGAPGDVGVERIDPIEGEEILKTPLRSGTTPACTGRALGG